MSNKSLIPVRPNDWAMIQSIAQEAYESRVFGVTKGEAAIKLLFCFEYGLPLSVANQGLYVVNKRLAVMGQICASRIRMHPDYDYKIENHDEKGCTVIVFRHEEEIGRATFNEKDAKRAELLDKDNWKKYPKDMYFNRAIARAQRWYAPDALSLPIYSAEEQDAEVDQLGEPVWKATLPFSQQEKTAEIPLSVEPQMIGVESLPLKPEPLPVAVTATPDPTAPTTITTEPQYATISDLLNASWTAEQIMVANEGKIPSTSEACQRVAEKLQTEGQDDPGDS